VESLGAVDVIVTDKTGTLTENQVTVQRLYFSGAVYEVIRSAFADHTPPRGPEPQGRASLMGLVIARPDDLVRHSA
jgi:P-type E1-E2 ATPase